MVFQAFLSASDAERAHRTIERLRWHRIDSLVLTGGMAMELAMLRLGSVEEKRPLNDIDFLVDSFDGIPKTLETDFRFRHVHPNDPPGKTLLQCIDPETAVRVDIFRACGSTVARATLLELGGTKLRTISFEDLAAYTVRLCMDLAVNTPMPAKHAKDLLRFLPLLDLPAMETSWREHRKPNHPQSFSSAVGLVTDLIAARRDLQIAAVYSQDVQQRCSRCQGTKEFPLAGAKQILSILGYC
jgi:hypothetical protein